MMDRLFLIIIVVVLFSACQSNSKIGPSAEGSIHDTIQLTEKVASGKKINITLHTAKFPSHFPYRKAFRWGVEGSEPKTLITSIDVNIEGEVIFVPLSAYSDLTNPHDASFKEIEGGFLITVQGGDAAASYVAELSFRKNFLKKRRVAHGEFPDQSWEETVYSYALEGVD